MASTPEAKVKRLVVDILKTHGAYYFFSATHGFGRSGVPDITVCLRGRFIFIECKAGKNKPTELQEREIAAAKNAGGVALVINENNMAELRAVLQEISNDNGNSNKGGSGRADTK
jgi:Holliday junction resolvase